MKTITFLLIFASTLLTGCSWFTKPTPPQPVNIVVSNIVVCDKEPTVDAIELQFVTWTPIWGYEVGSDRDVGIDSKGNALVGVVPKKPSDVLEKVWISLTSSEYIKLALNLSQIQQQTMQLVAIKDYYRSCVEQANANQVKPTPITPSLRSKIESLIPHADNTPKKQPK